MNNTETVAMDLVAMFTLDPDSFGDFHEQLRPHWFPAQLQASVKYMDEAHGKGEPWDLHLLAYRTGVEIGDIVRWTERCPILKPDNFASRIRIVRDSYFRDQVALTSDREEADELIEEWQSFTTDTGDDPGPDIYAEAVERITHRIQNPEPELPLPSQYLNQQTGGFTKGKFSVIAAPTSHNKTTFVVNCVLNALRRRNRVLYLDYEMGAPDILFSLLAIEKNIPIADLRLSRDKTKAAKAIQHLAGLRDRYQNNLRILEGAKWPDIIRAIDNFKPDMVVVDHIQIFGQVMPQPSGSSSAYHLSDISRKLSRLAHEKNVAMVVLSQVNRQSKGRMPVLAELKESGGIEENAHLALILYWPYRDDPTKQALKNELKIFVAKNRNGPCEIGRLFVKPETGLITAMAADDSQRYEVSV